MKTHAWRTWLWQYVLPAVAIAVTFPLMWLIWGDPDIVWLLVVAPALAFLAGLVVCPPRVWVIPVVVVGLLVASLVVQIARGAADDSASGVGFVIGLTLLCGFYTAVLSFCLLVGKWIRLEVDDWLADHRTPRAPVT